eukprot:CAMPEP_0204111272 /NCGR_PEP_ID=MMETSP0361-20130328/2357_1 /ASSEMBLY_ACC=CAM_ASM_000343 /TAXON_ID=268821 /ORGANISM="Scrippsiella Hangoei, Strain SHTV-5" /LENGTH=57 /DNA_ID=CAMNT_0051061283 /DNA_START=27 /DNA_END=200 /DNA_ORIENTATION=-
MALKSMYSKTNSCGRQDSPCVLCSRPRSQKVGKLGISQTRVGHESVQQAACNRNLAE